MLNTVFHVQSLRLAPAILLHALGPSLALVWAPLALVGVIAMLRRGWWPAGWLVLVPVAMAALFWIDLPVNIDARFFMPAVGLVLLPVAFAFGHQRAWNGIAHTLVLAGLAWVVVGARASLPGSLPWYMDHWLDLDGLVTSTSLLGFAALVALMAAVTMAVRRRALVLPILGCVVLSTGTVLAFGDDSWCVPGRCESVNVSDPFVRGGLINAWRWTDAHIHEATVAYTGINLPYPLAGPHLSNRVVYVNIDGHPSWRLDNYDRAYRAGRFSPLSPALAVSSGELEPIRPGIGPRDDAVRPRYERLEGFADLWTHNLDQLHVDDLFVARLSVYEIDYEAHDASGYPIEAAWAAQSPDRFTLIFEDEDARIYSVHGPGRRATGHDR
jgi:hypothetical protein